MIFSVWDEEPRNGKWSTVVQELRSRTLQCCEAACSRLSTLALTKIQGEQLSVSGSVLVMFGPRRVGLRRVESNRAKYLSPGDFSLKG